MGVLADALHLFNIAASLRSPVIAWSAGAMALTDRIVLFNDRAPQGPGHPEVYGSGLSVLRNLVRAAARQREAAARRHAPDGRLRPQVRPRPLCPAGDRAPRVDTDSDGDCPPGTRVLAADGRVTTLEAA